MSKRLSVTFDEGVYENFKNIAEKEGKSMSQIINQYIEVLNTFGMIPQVMIFSNLVNRTKSVVFIEGNEAKPLSGIVFEHKGGSNPYISIDYAPERTNNEVLCKKVTLSNKEL